MIGLDDGLNVGGAQISTFSTWVESGIIHQGRAPGGGAGGRQRANLDTVSLSCLGDGPWNRPGKAADSAHLESGKELRVISKGRVTTAMGENGMSLKVQMGASVLNTQP